MAAAAFSKHPFVTMHAFPSERLHHYTEQDLHDQSPPHGLEPDEWNLMNAAAQEGDLEMLLEAMGKKNDGFWAQAEGRKALRFVATLACTQKRRRVVSYLVLKHTVPLNTAPADELVLDKGYPRRQQNNGGMRPLLASILSKNEDYALFVLSLRPEEDLELECSRTKLCFSPLVRECHGCLGRCSGGQPPRSSLCLGHREISTHSRVWWPWRVTRT